MNDKKIYNLIVFDSKNIFKNNAYFIGRSL